MEKNILLYTIPHYDHTISKLLRKKNEEKKRKFNNFPPLFITQMNRTLKEKTCM